jgi:hypothetical protein
MTKTNPVKNFLRRKRRRQPPKDPVACAKMALKLAAKASEGPWSSCNHGKCSCKMVSTGDHPIAKVESGEWGDEWPSIRIVGDTSFDRKAEAFMEMSAYGSIDEKTARANAQLIAFARTALPILANAVLKRKD